MSRTLRTTVVRSGSVEGGALWLRVSDAGPGIPTQDRARVFEKYERLDRAGSGVGLGLTIARAAVEAQNGHLFVEDSSLGGACFAIEIPQRIVPASRDGS